MLDRREVLGALGVAALAPVTFRAFAAPMPDEIRWWSTSDAGSWQAAPPPPVEPVANSFSAWDVIVQFSNAAQAMRGFGGAFSELGWQALAKLPKAMRDRAIRDLFSDDGAAFTLCRTPLGADDFSRQWYSYDETDGDFALRNFSVSNDRDTLLPFINAAQQVRPELELWASPWSPPTWMKTNKHYAQLPSLPGNPPNGLKSDQIRREGGDTFIQDDRYFDAYARYFARYVTEYRKHGIPISMVMPQNEFNSSQPFPSCCWTPAGLSRFIPFLGREMDKLGVSIMLGTLERANADLITKVLNDPNAAPFIKGIGVQWAGKGALHELAKRHAELPIWGTEQECGVGANDWHYARYGWNLIKRYLGAGASVWQYWNMALPINGVSTWGWPQNALISVDTDHGRYTLNPDYWVMKHVGSQVRPGARYLPTQSVSGFENQIAFRNPNGDLVVVIENDMPTVQEVSIVFGGKRISPTLAASSYNTIVVPATVLATGGIGKPK